MVYGSPDSLLTFECNGGCIWEELANINTSGSRRNIRPHWLSVSDNEKFLLKCLVLYARSYSYTYGHFAFSHHVVHYEGQGGPVVPNSKPRQEVLAIIGRALENLRPDLQHLLSHLKPDTSSSIYAATHPKLVQNPAWPLRKLVISTFC